MAHRRDRNKYSNDPHVSIDRGRLKGARETVGRSTAEIAATISSSRQRLEHLEKRGSVCRQSLRAALAQALEVSVSWLAGRNVRHSPHPVELLVDARRALHADMSTSAVERWARLELAAHAASLFRRINEMPGEHLRDLERLDQIQTSMREATRLMTDTRAPGKPAETEEAPLSEPMGRTEQAVEIRESMSQVERARRSAIAAGLRPGTSRFIAHIRRVLEREARGQVNRVKGAGPRATPETSLGPGISGEWKREYRQEAPKRKAARKRLTAEGRRYAREVGRRLKAREDKLRAARATTSLLDGAPSAPAPKQDATPAAPKKPGKPAKSR